MQRQITLECKIADEEKIWEFVERAFLRRAGLTKDNDCEKCLSVPQTDCPTYEDCSGPIEGLFPDEIFTGKKMPGSHRIGTMEIAAPRVYFRGSLEDAYGGYRSITDYS
jgi:hypothetical protein